MSIQSEVERISTNVQNTIDTIEQTGVTVPENANSDNLPTLAQALANEKQNKLTGTQGQYVGFNSNGEAEAVESPVLVVHITLSDDLTGTSDKTADQILVAAQKGPVEAEIVMSGAITPGVPLIRVGSSRALFGGTFPGYRSAGSNPIEIADITAMILVVDGDGDVETATPKNLQEQLTGTSGQYVGFNSSGNAVAVDPPSSLPSGGSEGKLLGYGTEPEWVDNIADTCFQLDSTRMKSCKELGITDLNDVVEAGVYTGMSAPPEFPEIANVPGYYGTSGSPFKMTVEVTEGKGEFSGITVIHQTVMSASSPFFGPRYGWPSTYIREIQIISGSPYVGEWGAVPDIKVLTQKTVPSTSWSADSTYSSIGFNYRAAVNIGDIMPEDIPDVNFSPADQYSGNLASFADTYNGGVYIYAKTQPTDTVTIESAIFTRS